MDRKTFKKFVLALFSIGACMGFTISLGVIVLTGRKDFPDWAFYTIAGMIAVTYLITEILTFKKKQKEQG